MTVPSWKLPPNRINQCFSLASTETEWWMGRANSVPPHTVLRASDWLIRASIRNRYSSACAFAQRARVIMGNSRWRSWRVAGWRLEGENAPSFMSGNSVPPSRVLRGTRFNLFLIRSLKRAQNGYDLLSSCINFFPPSSLLAVFTSLRREWKTGSCWKIAFHREVIFHGTFILLFLLTAFFLLA